MIADLDRDEVVDAEVLTVVVDGIILDAETGEILGVADAPASSPGRPFSIDTEGAVRWVLERIRNREAAAAAAENDERVIAARALVEAADAIGLRERKAAARLRERFLPEILTFAEHELASRGGKPGRTLHYVEGTIKLTSIKGKLAVRDEASALELVKEAGFGNAVRTTEKLLVSELRPEQTDVLRVALGSDDVPDGALVRRAFEMTPDRTSVKVETGVRLS